MTCVPTRKSLATASVLIGLAGAAFCSPASAQSTRDQVLAIVSEAAKAAGAKEVGWDAVEGDDARFTLSGAHSVVEAEGKTTTVRAEKVTYTGAKPTAEGGYTADRIDATGVGFEMDDGSHLSVGTAAVVAYVGQPPARIKAGTTSGETFQRIELGSLLVTTDNGKKIPIASAVITAEDQVAGIPRRSSFEMKGLVVPLDPQDADVKPMTDLGYADLSLDVSYAGTWDDKTGRVTLDTLAVSAADMGRLDLTLALGGLTLDVAQKLKQAGGDDAKQMELLQGVTIEKARLRWTDASLTGRVLGAQAKEQGIEPKAYAGQLKMLLPMVLSTIGNKDFEKKIASAAGAFLDAPKSLTVSVAPTAPLPVSQVFGAAMMAPKSLPGLLGADVKAND